MNRVSLQIKSQAVSMTKILAINKFLLAIAVLLIPVNSAFAQLAAPSPTSTEMTTSLVSPDSKIDYLPLKNLLAAKKWRESNDETRRLMLQAVNRDKQGWLTVEDINNIPCWDLKTIDDLWKQASNGRFGFSVQYPIFVDTGNKPGRLMAPDAYDKFGTQVGWRQNNEWILFKENLNYSLDAPIGHLPNPRDEYQINGGRLEYTNLTKRIADCKIVAAPVQAMPKFSPSKILPKK
jgi:hypothetical protein